MLQIVQQSVQQHSVNFSDPRCSVRKLHGSSRLFKNDKVRSEESAQRNGRWGGTPFSPSFCLDRVQVHFIVPNYGDLGTGQHKPLQTQSLPPQDHHYEFIDAPKNVDYLFEDRPNRLKSSIEAKFVSGAQLLQTLVLDIADATRKALNKAFAATESCAQVGEALLGLPGSARINESEKDGLKDLLCGLRDQVEAVEKARLVYETALYFGYGEVCIAKSSILQAMLGSLRSPNLTQAAFFDGSGYREFMDRTRADTYALGSLHRLLASDLANVGCASGRADVALLIERAHRYQNWLIQSSTDK